MTGEKDERVSRWRKAWAFLRRIEAAAAATGDELRDARLDRHDERLAALEEKVGALRRAGAVPQSAAGIASPGSRGRSMPNLS